MGIGSPSGEGALSPSTWSSNWQVDWVVHRKDRGSTEAEEEEERACESAGPLQYGSLAKGNLPNCKLRDAGGGLSFCSASERRSGRLRTWI